MRKFQLRAEDGGRAPGVSPSPCRLHWSSYGEPAPYSGSSSLLETGTSGAHLLNTHLLSCLRIKIPKIKNLKEWRDHWQNAKWEEMRWVSGAMDSSLWPQQVACPLWAGRQSEAVGAASAVLSPGVLRSRSMCLLGPNEGLSFPAFFPLVIYSQDCSLESPRSPAAGKLPHSLTETCSHQKSQALKLDEGGWGGLGGHPVLDVGPGGFCHCGDRSPAGRGVWAWWSCAWETVTLHPRSSVLIFNSREKKMEAIPTI